jgi:hypothetical protein
VPFLYNEKEPRDGKPAALSEGVVTE